MLHLSPYRMKERERERERERGRERKRETCTRTSSKTFRSPSKTVWQLAGAIAFSFCSPHTSFPEGLHPPFTEIFASAKVSRDALKKKKNKNKKREKGEMKKVNPLRTSCTWGFTQQNYLNANLTPVAFQNTQHPGHSAEVA